MRITRRSVYSGLAGVGLLAGAGGIAAAAGTTDTTPPPSAVVEQADPTTDPSPPSDDTADTSTSESDRTDESDDHDGQDTPPAYTSSVQTAPEVESAEPEAADDAAEDAEDAALTALATVTPQEASAAALASQPGTVDDVELSNEHGNVVYEVEIVDAYGAEFDVIVDAGDASVLATQAENDPDMPAGYTSSIQTEPSAEDKADAALVALATVTPEQASAAALASQPGTVKEVDLSNEAGNVVYEVEVVDANGTEFEVIIDAGNAKVLASRAD